MPEPPDARLPLEGLDLTAPEPRGGPRSVKPELMPLAARMRPRSLGEIVGQSHVIGPGTPLRRLIEADQLASVIFWGPAGTGKTSLAWVIAAESKARFVPISAVSATVAEVRRIIAAASELLAATGRRTIVFLDEIHRFNKAQQDALLPAVEDGSIILIGATTENPYFQVNSPLLSRSLMFRLEPLSKKEIRTILAGALEDSGRGLGGGMQVSEEALAHVVDRSGGDARVALNTLEAAGGAAAAQGTSGIGLDLVKEVMQGPLVHYGEDAHYDNISAFIKSMRGSDPDAAVWWLAQMLEAGEDARFIARRMVIFASEDVGNADPQALVVAVAAAQAVEFVGLPEVQLNLAQAAIYLAAAPKSNASTVAISRAKADVQNSAGAEVPAHLRDSHYPGARKLGHGAGYKYPHDFPGGVVDQDYLPEGLKGRRYYEPADRGAEAEIKKRLDAEPPS